MTTIQMMTTAINLTIRIIFIHIFKIISSEKNFHLIDLRQNNAYFKNLKQSLKIIDLIMHCLPETAGIYSFN